VIIQGEQKPRIINLENFKDDDFNYGNDFTQFGYKIYDKDIITENKILLLEIKLKDRVHEFPLFKQYDKYAIINEQTQAFLNMVTFDIDKYLDSSEDIDDQNFNFFDSLELLGGKTLCEYKLN
jgi:hypothetical protein